jgi:hypothetical protein
MGLVEEHEPGLDLGLGFRVLPVRTPLDDERRKLLARRDQDHELGLVLDEGRDVDQLLCLTVDGQPGGQIESAPLSSKAIPSALAPASSISLKRSTRIEVTVRSRRTSTGT